jgi:type III restriction enzyme
MKFITAISHEDNKGKFKDTSGETKDDDSTYNLIMKEKEKLLDIENPLRFIFSHSALREGWDNPNVFQICTLNETGSEMKKRQEIGRGLRLAVNSAGERIFDSSINRLTVVANEAYEDFAKALQREIEEDCGVSFSGRIKDKSKKETIRFRKGFTADPKFIEIWEKIKHETTYRVEYDTAALIESGSDAIKKLPKIKGPVIHSVKKLVTMDKTGVGGDLLSENAAAIKNQFFPVPDVTGYIQEKTTLSRSTIFEIIKRSGRVDDIIINPQLFVDMSIAAIKGVLNELMVSGIKYERIGSGTYDMLLMELKDFETYLEVNYYQVKNSGKTIHENYIPLDSGVESRFAKDCETSEQVEFYFKLPGWFKIPTPIGSYNPDWAVVFKDEKKVYFVAETKSSLDPDKLRPDEAMKIRCGKAHIRVP